MTNGIFWAGESSDGESILEAREIRVKFEINFLQRPASCEEAILRARKVLRQELGSVQDNAETALLCTALLCSGLEHLLWPENWGQNKTKTNPGQARLIRPIVAPLSGGLLVDNCSGWGDWGEGCVEPWLRMWEFSSNSLQTGDRRGEEECNCYG